MNLPNKLTLGRLVMVPVFVAVMSVESLVTYALAYVIFVGASITDYYDGKIARERNLITNFGKLMDPLADKVLVASAFVMLMNVPYLNIPGWTIVAILAREFLVTGARSMAASDGTMVAANMWGKTKAMIQMIYIGCYLFLIAALLAVEKYAEGYYDQFAEILSTSSYWIIIFVALFTVYSGIQFARSNWASLNLGLRE